MRRAQELGYKRDKAIADLFGVTAQVLTNWKSRDMPAGSHEKVAAKLHWTVDQLLGQIPGDERAARDLLEAQLLRFYRGMQPERREDLLLLASHWFNVANPGTHSNNPFPSGRR